MAVCANKMRNGPASANQGHSTASQGSCCVHSALYLNPPPPLSTPFASCKTNLQNRLRQLITCGQSQMMPKDVIGG